ncbi:amino acid transporter heavy chain SLC3A2 isoform 1-T1 [Trichechus inunguis]
MSQDTEVDMKEVELNELEPEKQPMNAASGATVAAASDAEKNGLVKIKVPDNEAEEAKFTGLSKEELLKVAGSPSWVRTRWVLLVLFWLGWLGMLAGAVVIIVQAPRCRQLPTQRWWQKGALYRIGDIQAFQAQEAGKLTGLTEYLDYVSTLKVKGIVLGPVHNNQKDDLAETSLQQIDPAFGSNKDFESLLQSAKKKSIRVILDLTPNYRGQNSWFLPTQVDTVDTQMQAALKFWLEAGVDGFQVRYVENLTNASTYLAKWQNITQNFGEDRLLIAGTDSSDLQQILKLLNSTEDLLLTSPYLSSAGFTKEHAKPLVTEYLNAAGNHWCSWSVSTTVEGGGPFAGSGCWEIEAVGSPVFLFLQLSQAGLLTSFVPASLLRLYQLLLFTLPGTPIFSYGDEIGLEAAALPGQPAEAPVMLWNESSFLSTSRPSSGSVSANMTVKGQDGIPGSLLSLFRQLSGLRSKERALLHGDFHALSSGTGLFSYVRQWDQNNRFLVVLNFGNVRVPATLEADSLPSSASLPAKAELLLSTEPGRKEGVSLELQQLNLEPNEGLLFSFPSVA